MKNVTGFIHELPPYQRGTLFFVGIAVFMLGAMATLEVDLWDSVSVGIDPGEETGVVIVSLVKAIEILVTTLGLCAAIPPLGVLLFDKVLGGFAGIFNRKKAT